MRNWQGMTRTALDAAYANADHIHAAQDYLTLWPDRAATFRAKRPPETVSYGAHPRARIDIFRPDGPVAGLVVFVHGGYWRRFDRTDWSHLAAGALNRGHAVAIPGYALAPDHRISRITTEIARAIDLAATLVPGPVRLAGHSAGGHLVARMVMADAAPACRNRIAACIPISPVADLRPLVAQSMNADLHLTMAEAVAESPALGAKDSDAAVSVHVGAEERPAFLWQARALAQAWDAPVRIAQDRHHFDVIDALIDPQSSLMADLLAEA